MTDPEEIPAQLPREITDLQQRFLERVWGTEGERGDRAHRRLLRMMALQMAVQWVAARRIERAIIEHA